MSEQKIEAAALHLPRHERARLAKVLLASLKDDDETAQLWAAEAERRDAELRSGEVSGIPADEVLERLRTRLK